MKGALRGVPHDDQLALLEVHALNVAPGWVYVQRRQGAWVTCRQRYIGMGDGWRRYCCRPAATLHDNDSLHAGRAELSLGASLKKGWVPWIPSCYIPQRERAAHLCAHRSGKQNVEVAAPKVLDGVPLGLRV
jgi:hypothetical protein